MSSLFSLAQSLPRGWIGPVSDSTYTVQLKISKLLYPRLCLRNSWIPRIVTESEEQNPSGISDLAYSHDGKTLVAGSADQNIYVFDPNTGKIANTLKVAHNSPITRVCYIKGSQFVSGSEDSTIALWDLRKAKEPLNRMQGHSSAIRSLDYNRTSELLASSSMDQSIRYWHIPTFQTKVDDQHLNGPLATNFTGILAKCPDMTHVGMHQDGSILVVLNSHGTLFVVYNVDMLPLSEMLKSVRLDDTLSLQLGWINPNCSMTRKNRIRVLSGDDYCPVGQGSISKVSGIQFHPTLPLVMARLTMASTMGFSRRTTEWSCAIDLKQSLLDSPSNFIARKSYGSDILDETLLFFKEEKKSGIVERKHSFSKCGKVISSPGKEHVTLLTFSPDYRGPYDPKPKATKSTMSDLFVHSFSSSRSSQLTTVGEIKVPGEVTCSKFSPCDMLLLTVGQRKGHVSFYHPIV